MTFYELRLSKMIYYDNHNISYQEDIIWINFRLINVERTMKNLEISLSKSLVKSKELLILLVVVSKICSSSIVSHPTGIVCWLYLGRWNDTYIDGKFEILYNYTKCYLEFSHSH